MIGNQLIRGWSKMRVAYSMLGIAVFGLLVYGIGTRYGAMGVVVPLPAAQTQVEQAQLTAVLSRSEPVRLRIPAINLETSFEGGLGLNDDQTIAVPESFTDVGWYQYGPTPGELGPAVVLGHVDSFRGPAVFWSLGQLKENDEILIDRHDGTTARFIVTELRQVAQNTFPTSAVYGDIDHAGLRLITCSGRFDRGVQRYSHNLIVFARLVE